MDSRIEVFNSQGRFIFGWQKEIWVTIRVSHKCQYIKGGLGEVNKRYLLNIALALATFLLIQAALAASLLTTGDMAQCLGW